MINIQETAKMVKKLPYSFLPVSMHIFIRSKFIKDEVSGPKNEKMTNISILIKIFEVNKTSSGKPGRFSKAIQIIPTSRSKFTLLTPKKGSSSLGGLRMREDNS